MSSLKKTDWLRHLYLEGTKWEKALPGKVPWHTFNEVKDPNNGSKLTVGDIEKHLPKMLRHCIDNSLVPYEYIPEVKKFMAYIGKDEKFDTRSISKYVQKRKMAMDITVFVKRFLEMSDREKATMTRKIESQDCHCILDGVQKLRTMTDKGRSPEYKAEECEEKSKTFKLIDWLRHIYLCCQKWLNDCKGQVQWEKLKVKDPNNSKQGSRMKMEELKESLKILAGQCLQLGVVPQIYQEEVMEARRILEENLVFDTKKLDQEEKLRKIAVMAVEVLKGMEDRGEEVIGTIDPANLPMIRKGLQELEVNLEEQFVVDRAEVEEEPAEKEMHNEMEDEFPEDIFNTNEVDGTDILESILDKQNPSTLVASDEVDFLASDPIFEPLEEPGSVPSLCYVSDFSEASPVPSPEKYVDGHVSDDSGIHSPMSGTQDDSDSEDEDLTAFVNDFIDLEEDTEDIDIEDLELPDTRLYLPDMGKRCLKRKVSDNIDEPVMKKRRP
ncbi:uncharacterized protein LOC125378160 [Haliotis rufescens]|uniref:uncharacterized protein LOC125378160 n=1 Tax=Haliotis rufescens TaxID=6454 RepID=UPI00201FA354|nr:uncharacterized protein LOC125378160 [Haliotis rufescens]